MVEDTLPADGQHALDLKDDKQEFKSGNLIYRNKPKGTITWSVRATTRMLYRTLGWSAVVRGFLYENGLCLILSTTRRLAARTHNGKVVILVGLLTRIAIAPLVTAFTHTVIATPTPGPGARRRFLSRLRAARQSYAANWLPTIIAFGASHLLLYLTNKILYALRLNLYTPEELRHGPNPVKYTRALCVWIGLMLLVADPVETALFRVNASLLPADEETLVHFDRTLGGRVEPGVVSSVGLARFIAALRTVTFSSWIRLYLLRLKMFFLVVVVYITAANVFVMQLKLLRAFHVIDFKD